MNNFGCLIYDSAGGIRFSSNRMLRFYSAIAVTIPGSTSTYDVSVPGIVGDGTFIWDIDYIQGWTVTILPGIVRLSTPYPPSAAISFLLTIYKY